MRFPFNPGQDVVPGMLHRRYILRGVAVGREGLVVQQVAHGDVPLDGNVDRHEDAHVVHAGDRDGGRVEGVVGDGALLVPQHEHLVLQADEVDVLVEQLLLYHVGADG